MNLVKLFETQRILDARIEKEHPKVVGESRLAKKILALLVEIGECANEWRGFKFWSTNQEPRTVKRIATDWDEDGTPNEWDVFPDANPLLEEYVDGLHFTLSLGNELGLKVDEVLEKDISKWISVEKQFTSLYKTVSSFTGIHDYYVTCRYYEQLIHSYIALGKMLGFTWEQIEDAYYAKNKINHDRQATGY